MKQADSGDLMRAWGGIASLQLALPVLWTAAEQRGFGLEELGTWLCEGPAVLAGQAGQRGKIAVGYRADFVVWEPRQSFTVEKEGIYHRHKMTPYLGEKLYGVVEQTWLRGEKVFDRAGPVFLKQGRIVT
jgi:allantoinase